MNGQYSASIQQKVADGLAIAPPPLTPRTIYTPAIPGKVLATIGMRRAGKTYFLWQCLAERRAQGIPTAEILTDFPRLTVEEMQAAFWYAAAAVANEDVFPRSLDAA
jgi:hypothetical protein